jgi:hypothetical protein
MCGAAQKRAVVRACVLVCVRMCALEAWHVVESAHMLGMGQQVCWKDSGVLVGYSLRVT